MYALNECEYTLQAVKEKYGTMDASLRDLSQDLEFLKSLGIFLWFFSKNASEKVLEFLKAS